MGQSDTIERLSREIHNLSPGDLDTLVEKLVDLNLSSAVICRDCAGVIKPSDTDRPTCGSCIWGYVSE